MNTLERRQWRRSGVFIVNCEHILNFILIVNFENIVKTNTIEDKIGYIMGYVVVFQVQTKFINK